MGGWHQILVVLMVDWGAATTDNFKRCRIEDDEERVQQKFGHNRAIHPNSATFLPWSTMLQIYLHDSFPADERGYGSTRMRDQCQM
ncbi:unnamed protein product [Toxocara canis]|uniref:Secreted protein n=1 Tax=Toxocara canis TaxID=6265 RepID=A0A183VFF5_TOXCA|nr:unnamed protein product [Toxocara canis]